MKQSRTHTCGELRLSDAGKQVTIVGWLENVREVGANFAFCVLRDFYGTTQFVIENETMMSAIKPLNKETTLSVTGTPPRIWKKSFSVSICGMTRGTSAPDAATVSARYFLKNTMERLFGKMKQRPPIFPSA